MKTGKNGISLIKQFEGVRLESYPDPATKNDPIKKGEPWTIGYGHTGTILGKKVAKGMKIPLEQAEKLLISDLTKFENAINASLKVPITQNQFDALISFTYNVGIGNFQKSTLLKLINKKDVKASEQFLLWNKANGKVLTGLTKRRQAEKLLFDKK